jgi:phospholipid/cholesterol/gamma-HCH transport system substrate-binding protein
MQHKQRNEILVGAFLCVGFALFVLLLFLMGSLDALLQSTTVVEADFEDVQSLEVGDNVYLFGRKAGKVTGISLLPRKEGERAAIRVAMVMPADSRPYLREDSLVKIDKSLTGNISVLIQESSGNPLPPDGRLKGSPSTDLASITEKVNRVLDEGEKAVAAVSRLVSTIESKGDIPAALAEAAGLLKDVRTEFPSLKDRLDQALAVLKDVVDENRLDLRHTIANLKETTGEAKGVVADLRGAPEKISRSLTEIEKAGAEVAAVVRENRGQIGSLLEDLNETSANLSNLTADVKRRPWRLLYRPSASELAAMDLYDAAWAYNLGATELNRSLRDLTQEIEKNGGKVDGSPAIAELRQAIAARLEKQRQVEDLFWEKLRAE